MKIIILLLSIICANGLLFINVYTSLVDARSWGADIPNSIATAREYAKKYNPGTFFKAFSPISQILALTAPIICWQISSVRLYSGIAFILYILADILTFLYFYPRNDIMFKTAQLSDIEKLSRAWKEWSTMNWARSLLIFIGLCFSLIALYELCCNQIAIFQ
ncbi:DUF1772 domain-containing protein [Mucilaginibacter sp. HC2]|uniref:DUF1772 domain-containing protein n=1 Tax=Mucilaginibacter inviolabilis TaxID=2714892 RepID=UPI00140D306D|nr:DUF1772 domain-containing protein [Mucilaginibacter inviolabilis]NHA02482.1 DUF1772 domain-containing protein [Mucilaginibacter inviolabilis]